VASSVAALISYGVAIWEHLHDKPLSAFVLLAITVPLFWIGAMVAWRRVRKEVETLRLVPAKIKVTTYELQRTLRLHGKKEGRHVFLRAKLELMEPLQATVTKYRMELARDGVFENLEFQDDLARWEITDWSQDPIPHDEMRPLPTRLKCGDLVEGWVHFVTDRNNQELDRSRVRLFVDTPLGTGSAEIAAGHEYWNVIANRMVMEK